MRSHVELDWRSQLARKYRPLSSVDSRGQLVTMGAFLAFGDPDDFERVSGYGRLLHHQGALPAARAAKAYDDDAYVSLETLRAEIQEKDDVNVYKLSGMR